MKTNGLMIGDWVYLSFDLLKDACKPFPARINMDYLVNTYYGKFVAKPIPLSEEILKANGFENMIFDNGNPTDMWKLSIDSSHFCINIDRAAKYWWISSIDAYIHFHYVHELQHALRLCGLNDLADNFKIE